MNLNSDEATVADLFRWLDRRMSRQESSSAGPGAVRQYQSIVETEGVTDSVTAVEQTAGWVWDESEWGVSSW